MNERILKIRKSLKMNQSDFASGIGLQQRTLSNIEQGNTRVSEQTIKLLGSVYGVNEDFLRNGNGEMFNRTQKLDEEIFEMYQKMTPAMKEHFLKIGEQLLEIQEDPADTDG